MKKLRPSHRPGHGWHAQTVSWSMIDPDFDYNPGMICPDELPELLCGTACAQPTQRETPIPTGEAHQIPRSLKYPDDYRGSMRATTLGVSASKDMPPLSAPIPRESPRTPRTKARQLAFTF